MEIKVINNRDEWNGFVTGQENSQFLQAWEWGGFQEQAGNKVIRIGVLDNGKLAAAATLIKKKMFAGYSYFYCPRGPVINFRIKNYQLRINIFNDLIGKIREIAEKENAIFLRLEPQFSILNSKFLIKKTIDIQPSKTLLLDLTKSEDELLAGMRQKTRYNIRLAEKKGVTVREAASADFEAFWKLMQTTRDRDGFRLHNKEHYTKMLENTEGLVKLLVAEYQNRILAANIVALFGDSATYVHGASSSESREVMAPYALQWQTIKLAKAQGCKFYDFHGVDEKKWPGVTRFKTGFGGSVKEWPGTMDVIFNKSLYKIYILLRKARRIF